ncbi:cation:proton antiporter [Clostridium sp. CM028]|uniref:monovalent cation/H+ antiporter complex subunit F n=1 Tax=unclassified Clostridium TaxID=2614128 RepID=UPI001C0DE3A8|nr:MULTISPECIES: monovalent cation/H+ antiporter complex subunit F [unclassified Clostridium]MBU3092224.1 cation:proton antiporter [Clostridium sp. CF011]MBW9144041.1 cation:proton antiporter [Clostridium sp. CM027]MBW9147648.1 cation:proton antiporter [Clostridium sp. CM028]UVE41307.1 cation:proton antiporter [Clostridium sp. CM027]WAG70305.1 cation:proton antiporter [Clostridium sp. CF011]
MSKLLIFSILFLAATIFLCMLRAIKGPSAADRLIAINVIGTKTIVLILIVSFLLNETYFVDVAIVYALISFLSSIVIAKFIGNSEGRNI